MRRPAPRNRPEPTIALINIVFLMLVFFMVAGTLATPPEKDLKLVKTAELEGREPANALVLTPEGALRFMGQNVEGPYAYLATLEDRSIVRILPDQNAPASELVALSRNLRALGAEKVMIVTERALE